MQPSTDDPAAVGPHDECENRREELPAHQKTVQHSRAWNGLPTLEAECDPPGLVVRMTCRNEKGQVEGMAGQKRPTEPPAEGDVLSQQRTKEILVQQLAMNKETWKLLVAHGLTPESQVRLDFVYHAPSQQKAATLHSSLKRETDYDVEVSSSGGLLWKRWEVTGSTRETKITLEILDQWVAWMVAAGGEHDCVFDGWGTQV
jgi:hypothetical protein